MTEDKLAMIIHNNMCKNYFFTHNFLLEYAGHDKDLYRFYRAKTRNDALFNEEIASCPPRFTKKWYEFVYDLIEHIQTYLEPKVSSIIILRAIEDLCKSNKS